MPVAQRLRIIRSLEAAKNTRTECYSGSPARWKAVSGLWPHRPSARFFTRPSGGKLLPRCCPRQPELWECALGTWPTSSRVLPSVSGPLPGRAWHFSSRTRGCGRSHSPRCPRGHARSRARPGRYPVVVGTLLHAPQLWEIPLGTSPTSSGLLPGSPVLLPGPLGTRPVSSRLLPAPVLHTVIPIHQAATLLRLVANAGQVVSNTSLLGPGGGTVAVSPSVSGLLDCANGMCDCDSNSGV